MSLKYFSAIVSSLLPFRNFLNQTQEKSYSGLFKEQNIEEKAKSPRGWRSIPQSFTYSCVPSVQMYYRPNKVTLVRSRIRGVLPRVVQDVTVGTQGALPPLHGEAGLQLQGEGAGHAAPAVGFGAKPHSNIP